MEFKKGELYKIVNSSGTVGFVGRFIKTDDCGRLSVFAPYYNRLHLSLIKNSKWADHFAKDLGRYVCFDADYITSKKGSEDWIILTSYCDLEDNNGIFIDENLF